MSAATASCFMSTRGGVASSSASAAAAAASTPVTAIRRRCHSQPPAGFIKPLPSYSRLVSVRAEPLGSKEAVQPFDEGAAQVQRLLKRDRLELLGEGDSLEDFISASEFADDDGDGGGDKSKASPSSPSAAPASPAAAAAPISAAPVSPFGASAAPTSPFGGGGGGGAAAASADSASLGGGLRGSVFGSGGAAGSPFAAGGLPTSQGASGLYKEAERMPGEMNRGLFGEGDESYNIPSPPNGGGGESPSSASERPPWWSGISLSQVLIAASFLFTISLMLATAWFVNSVGAIRFNE